MSELSYQLSYWEKEAFLQDFDFLIVGSGIVGLNAALKLRMLSPTARIGILERGPLPIGASTRNAGFACFGSVSELLEDIGLNGSEAVMELLKMRWDGLKKLRDRLGDKRMGYVCHGGYELFQEKDKVLFEKCKNTIPDLNIALEELIGEEAIFSCKDESIPKNGLGNTQHLIFNKAEGQIHTGWMMHSLLSLVRQADIPIFTGVEVAEIQDMGMGGVNISTKFGWEIKTGKLLIATNGFARKLLPEIEVQPARNQVLITKPISSLRLKGCFHYDHGYYYFRNINNRILLGGGRKLALEIENTSTFGTTGLIRNHLIQFLQEVVMPESNVEVDYWWSGIMGVGQKKAPIIKELSDNIAVAVRMGGMGVAIGCLVGENGADLMNG